jgi:hypothetical protein
MQTTTQTDKSVPITSRRFLSPLPTHHRPSQLERIEPEDGAHRTANEDRSKWKLCRCRKLGHGGDQTRKLVGRLVKLDVGLQAMVYLIKQCSCLPLAMYRKRALSLSSHPIISPPAQGINSIVNIPAPGFGSYITQTNATVHKIQVQSCKKGCIVFGLVLLPMRLTTYTTCSLNTGSLTRQIQSKVSGNLSTLLELHACYVIVLFHLYKIQVHL